MQKGRQIAKQTHTNFQNTFSTNINSTTGLILKRLDSTGRKTFANHDSTSFCPLPYAINSTETLNQIDQILDPKRFSDIRFKIKRF